MELINGAGKIGQAHEILYTHSSYLSGVLEFTQNFYLMHI